MADNTVADPGAGGDTFRSKDRVGVKTTIVGLDLNPAGAEVLGTGDATNGLDVDVTRAPGTVADGGTLPAVIYIVGGYDGAAAQALATDSTGVAQVDIASIAAGDANIGNVDVVTLPALPAGTNNIGDVDVLTLPALPAGTNNIGDVDVLTLPALAAGSNLIGAVNVKPATSGGLSIARDLDLDETELEIKASAGQLFGWYIYNDGAAEVFVKLYNDTALNVVVGTTAPVMTVPIPAGSAANVEFTNGIAFSAGICAAATTGIADTDVAAPALNAVVANFLYA